MPVYLFIAQSHDPRTRQPYAPLPAKHLERFVLYFPGDRVQAEQYAKQSGLGSWRIRQYDCYPLVRESPSPVLLCFQPVMPVQMSAQHVQGGQPTGAPVAQPGAEEVDGETDSMGFQNLGTGALSTAQDPMFGSGDDGTYTDLYQGAHGTVKVPRQQ